MDLAVKSLKEYTRKSKELLLTTTKNCPITNRKINRIDEKANNDDDRKMEGKTGKNYGHFRREMDGMADKS